MKSIREIISESILKWFVVLMVVTLLIVGVDILYVRIVRFGDYAKKYLYEISNIMKAVLNSYSVLLERTLSGKVDTTIFKKSENLLWFVITKNDRILETNLSKLSAGDIFSPPMKDKEIFIVNLENKAFLVVHKNVGNMDGYLAVDPNIFKKYIKLSFEESFIVSQNGYVLMSTKGDYHGKTIALMGLDMSFLEDGSKKVVGNFLYISWNSNSCFTTLIRLNIFSLLSELTLSIIPLFLSMIVGMFILSCVLGKAISNNVLVDIERLVDSIDKGEVEEFETDVLELNKIAESLQIMKFRFESIQNILLGLISFKFDPNTEEMDIYIGILREMEDFVIPLFSDKIASIYYLVEKNGQFVKVYDRFFEGFDKEMEDEITANPDVIKSLVEDLSSISIWEKSDGLVSLVIPLRIEGEVKLVVIINMKEEISKMEMYTGNVLAVAYNVVVEHARVMYKFNMMATTDFLTGLKNRHYFINRLNEECERAKRYGGDKTFGVSMIDVDGLKMVNDTYGHEAGDELLKAVADLLKRITRKSDIIGRLGGDEFAIIWLNIKPEDVKHLEEKFLKEVKALKLEKYGVDVMASIGTAVYGIDGTTPDELLNTADMRMYKMKMTHKNHRK